MRTRLNTLATVWLGLLATGVMAAAMPAQAQNGYDQRNGAPLPPRIEFRVRPQWTAVPGTNVMMIRRDQRPAYDMFGYGSRYYVFDNGNWYQSDSWSGPFSWLDERSLPTTIRQVPENEWLSYPSGWRTNNNNNGSYDDNNYPNNGNGRYDLSRAPAPPRTHFRFRLQWTPIGGTGVSMIRQDQRPAYDMFAYGSRYYLFNNDYWYQSDSWNGPFSVMDERDIPAAFRQVPQSEWQSYPSEWASNNNDRNYDNNRSYDNGRNSNDRNWRYDVARAPAPPQMYFRRTPRWGRVPGTQVMIVRDRNRPDYDMFRLGSKFYLEVDGYWYRSNRWNGPYAAIDQRSIPNEFSNVPRQYWRSYPANWAVNARYPRRQADRQ